MTTVYTQLKGTLVGDQPRYLKINRTIWDEVDEEDLPKVKDKKIW